MTWYKTGTVSVTNNSAEVTLTGGDALQNIFPDDGFVGPDGRTYAVLTVNGAGSFTLSTDYKGATAAGAGYLIIPSASYTQLRDVLTQINTLIATYQSITLNAGVGLFAPGSAASPGVRAKEHEGSGLVWNADGSVSISVNGTVVGTFNNGGGVSAITFPDGTVNEPGFRFTNDPDTGIWRPGENNLSITVGGASVMRLTPSKNVGIGTDFPERRLDVWGETGPGNIAVVRNARQTSGGDWHCLDTYVDPDDNIVRYYSVGSNEGSHRWGSVSDLMHLGSNGRLGVGTTNPLAKTHFAGGSVEATSPVAGSAGDNVVQFLTNSAYVYGLMTGVSGNGVVWQQVQRADGVGTLYALSLQSLGGGVSIGRSPDVGPTTPLHVKNTNFGGEILRVETSTPRGGGNGFIGIADPAGRKGYFGYGGSSDAFYWMNELDANLFLGTNSVLRLVVGSNSSSLAVWSGADNTYSFGLPGNRWSVIYAATGTINTSDEREKNWIGEPSPAAIAAALQIIDELGFFTWVGGEREHFGPRAQRVWAICAEHGLVDPIGENGKPGETPLAFLCYDEWPEETEEIWEERTIPAKYTGEGEDRKEVEPERVETFNTGETRVTLKAGDRYGIRSDQLNMFMIYALNARRKEQDTLIDALTNRLDIIEERLNNG